MNNIMAINLIFANGDNIILNNQECKDFYITNLTKEGKEIPYEQTIIKNKLSANFCLIKIDNKELDHSKLKRIKNQKDIIELQVIFDSNKYIMFDIASDANPFDQVYHNNLEYIYENEDNFGILLSDYNIKYKDNLFA